LPTRAAAITLPVSAREGSMQYEWAGLSFLVLGRHDAAMLRGPGVYALVRRGPGETRALLFAGYAASVAQSTGPGHAAWHDAMALGMNEVHVFLGPPERLDGLQLAARVVRHTRPPLNPQEGPRQGRMVSKP
jgi:hypothetical protein